MIYQIIEELATKSQMTVAAILKSSLPVEPPLREINSKFISTGYCKSNLYGGYLDV